MIAHLLGTTYENFMAIWRVFTKLSSFKASKVGLGERKNSILILFSTYKNTFEQEDNDFRGYVVI